MTLEGHYFNNAHLPNRNKITILIFYIQPQEIRIQRTLLQLKNNALVSPLHFDQKKNLFQIYVIY